MLASGIKLRNTLICQSFDCDTTKDPISNHVLTLQEMLLCWISQHSQPEHKEVIASINSSNVLFYSSNPRHLLINLTLTKIA